MRKCFAILLTALLLLGVAASAEGILPVLQTPVPITDGVSYHYFMNYSTPTASKNSDGCYCYSYEADYAHYLSFGRALAQEGYTLAGVEELDDGTGAIIATVEKENAATLTILYNEDKRSLVVTYPQGAIALDADAENPYVVDEAQASALPELKQVISLHAVTAVGRPNGDYITKLPEGGYCYRYNYVPYPAYTRFSVKLGEEGFSLVSSSKTEDGLDRAVVSDGEVELTIDYNQENQCAYVYYPAFAHARDAVLFDDFDVVRDGEPFSLGDNITATITGWEAVDMFHNNYNGTDCTSGDGTRYVVVLMDIDYGRPTGTQYGYLLQQNSLHSNEEGEIVCFGKLRDTDPYYDIQRYYDDITGREHFAAGIGLRLTEEEAADPQGVAITFTGLDCYIPYVYYLTPQQPELDTEGL